MAGLSSQLALGFPDSRLLKLELHGTYMGSRGLDYIESSCLQGF